MNLMKVLFNTTFAGLLYYKLLRQLLCRLILCRPLEVQACVKNLVAEQCGDEIANVLDVLAGRLRTVYECPTSRVRSTGHKKRRGIII
jgi:hypothetical protein